MNSEEINGQIKGTFAGYNGGAVFRLVDGQVWQQKIHKYKYKYANRPAVRVFENNGQHFIEVEGMDDFVPVVKVSIVEEGQIVSDFKGFDQGVHFKFQSGRVWVPNEYKYIYHYAYMPHGVIVDGINGLKLSVEGMSETIRVRQA
jgi:hypothetical protein